MTAKLYEPSLCSLIEEDGSVYSRRRAFSLSEGNKTKGRRRPRSESPVIRIPPSRVEKSLSVERPDSPVILKHTPPPTFDFGFGKCGHQEEKEEQMALIESANLSQQSVRIWSRELISLWLEDGKDSYLAFEALLQLLEVALEPSQDNYYYFAALLDTLGPKTVIPFLKEALPYLVDSDFQYHSDYIDILLLYLTLYQVHTGENILESFVKEVTEFSGLYLREHGKRFHELFSYIHSNEDRHYDENRRILSIKIRPHYLACMHVAAKKVIVSNAPPIKLKRRRLLAKEKFECEVSAGGLVSGIKPSLQPQDVWVSYLDAKVLDLDRMPKHMVPRMIKEGVKVAPKTRRSTSLLRYSFSVDADEEDYTEFLYEKTENDFMSLQRRLDRFAEQNFVVNPLIILKEEHTAFYNGISNGLFWPAFHNLPQFIVQEYKGTEGKHRLAEDWQKYIKVNFHFSIHAARSCRQQDFLWIHDYHLFLAGGIIRSLDPSLDCGFFLHIPFRISEEFMASFPEQGVAVLRGLLGYTRVGFQSNKDTLNFVHLVQRHIGEIKVENRGTFESLIFTIRHGTKLCLTTDVGTFPISIKTDRLLAMGEKCSWKQRETLRDRIMQGRKGKLFLSVERFDYTKGILERLEAINLYLEKYPERAQMDLFYQIAAASRTDISSYKTYQDAVLQRINEINEKYAPLIIVDQSNQPQETVVLLFQMANVAVITPAADGMNLVIKEAILCNPNMVLVLSTGAGAENQLFDAGLGDCYLQVPDISDKENFADILHRAINIPPTVAASCGAKLYSYTLQHDIDHWIESFTSSQWTSQVTMQRALREQNDLELLRSDLRKLRKKVTTKFDSDDHLGVKEYLSFQRCLTTVLNACDTSGICKLQMSSTNPTLVFNNLTTLLMGIDLDLKTLKHLEQNNNSPKSLWISLLAEESKLTKEIFEQQHSNLYGSLKREGPADLVICQSDIFFQDGEQSATSGILLHRFFARFAQQTVIVSDLSLADLQERSCFPESFCGGFCAADGCRFHSGKPVHYYSHSRSTDVEMIQKLLERKREFSHMDVTTDQNKIVVRNVPSEDVEKLIQNNLPEAAVRITEEDAQVTVTCEDKKPSPQQRLEFMFEQGMYAVKGCSGRVVVFANATEDLETWKCITNIGNVKLTLVTVCSHHDLPSTIKPEFLGNVIEISDINVIYTTAIEFILANVFTASV